MRHLLRRVLMPCGNAQGSDALLGPSGGQIRREAKPQVDVAVAS